MSTADKMGWTPSPDGRGTMTIIWSCMLTTFLCCWSVLIINVPEPGSSRSAIILRKVFLLGLCAAAPEIIFQVALGQWLSAKRSVRLFHEAGYHDWTLRHSFFLDMGGLHLRSAGYPSFPINSKQLHYLVTKFYVDYPRIEESQIRDKNKVDGVLRSITFLQTLLFIVNIIMRAAQGLTITALELSTAAFVFLSVLTTLLWIQKPADVQRCDFIEAKVLISTIRTEGHATDTVYSHTPLDFISREEWPWSILWMHGLNCLRRLNLAAQPQQLPVQRFHNTTVPVIKGWPLAAFAVLSLIYFGIFMTAWNFDFPTDIELTLWRASSSIALVTASGCFLTQKVFFNLIPALSRMFKRQDFRLPKTEASQNQNLRPIPKSILRHFLSLLRNNSTSNDPALDTPIGAVMATWFFGFVYIFSRGYIVLADFIELRALPSDAYRSTNWATLAPFIP